MFKTHHQSSVRARSMRPWTHWQPRNKESLKSALIYGHGVSGRKDEGCPNFHPDVCWKHLKRGRFSGGCLRKKECPKYHLKICQSSYRERKCLDTTCRTYHLQGTVRVDPKPNLPLCPQQPVSPTVLSPPSQSGPAPFLGLPPSLEAVLKKQLDQTNALMAVQQQMLQVLLQVSGAPRQDIHAVQGVATAPTYASLLQKSQAY